MILQRPYGSHADLIHRFWGLTRPIYLIGAVAGRARGPRRRRPTRVLDALEIRGARSPNKHSERAACSDLELSSKLHWFEGIVGGVEAVGVGSEMRIFVQGMRAEDLC
jgi:hypothetical protein